MQHPTIIIETEVGRIKLTALHTPVGNLAASDLGSAGLWLMNRLVIRPAIDPMMQAAPAGWFFSSHLLFGA